MEFLVLVEIYASISNFSKQISYQLTSQLNFHWSKSL